jgi:PAS domain S-box-containing protein
MTRAFSATRCARSTACRANAHVRAVSSRSLDVSRPASTRSISGGTEPQFTLVAAGDTIATQSRKGIPVALDSLELQLASAVQRFNQLQRRAETNKEPISLLARSLAELSTALEEVRVAQEQIVEGRARMEQLQEDLRRQAERYWQLFDDIPQPYVVTKPTSAIIEANKAAAELFNVSQRFLVGKTLSVFVCEERTSFLDKCAQVAAEGTVAEFSLKIRPRERAPRTVGVRVQGDASSLRWLLRPDD